MAFVSLNQADVSEVASTAKHCCLLTHCPGDRTASLEASQLEHVHFGRLVKYVSPLYNGVCILLLTEHNMDAPRRRPSQTLASVLRYAAATTPQPPPCVLASNMS